MFTQPLLHEKAGKSEAKELYWGSLLLTQIC